MSNYEIIEDDSSLEGLRRKRIIAWAIDVTLIAMLTALVSTLLLILGFVTLGLTWLLFAFLFGGITTIIALLYSGMSVNSDLGATPGMRAMGLRFRLNNGERPGFIYGAVHLVLFYLSVSILTPLVLAVSLITPRKRLLHDIVLGVEIS
jgi:uncharacterized RDD family membrane protein YckC